MAIKQPRLLSVHLSSSQNRVNASIFTAELEAIVSAFHYIKNTTKSNTFVLVTLIPHCMPCRPSGIIHSSHCSNYDEIFSVSS